MVLLRPILFVIFLSEKDHELGLITGDFFFAERFSGKFLSEDFCRFFFRGLTVKDDIQSVVGNPAARLIKNSILSKALGAGVEIVDFIANAFA